MKDKAAFPLHDTGHGSAFDKGMTLRDYFAGRAMQAIIGREDNRFTTTLDFVSAKAYQYADAMMKAREA